MATQIEISEGRNKTMILQSEYIRQMRRNITQTVLKGIMKLHH